MTAVTSLRTRPLLLGPLTLLAVSTIAGAFSTANASDRLIRRCDAVGAGDISMSARYEVRSSRKKFSVELEAATPGAFHEGQRIAFVVADQIVGRETLQPVIGGDLVADLNLDTRPNPADDENPFPANFPQVTRGTTVQIMAGTKTVLGCDLR